MLKKICGLFLGLVVCAGSACVTPTHASSANNEVSGVESLVITRIQASGEFGAKDEYVVLHNNSAVELNITNWCLINKSNVWFVCFMADTRDEVIEFYVPPYGDVVVVSRDHANASSYPLSAYTKIYDVINQSSGNIVNSSDAIIVAGGGQNIDTKTWSSAIPTGKVLARMLLIPEPAIYADTNSDADWVMENRSPLPYSSVRLEPANASDPTPNPDPEPNPDTTPDTNPEPDPQEESSNEPTPLQPPIITEILANPSGSDVGKEFIELYNPNEHDTISLDTFTFLIGTSSVKSYAFPAGVYIPPLGYVVITNEEINYTLVNTTGRVQLAKDGVHSGEAVEYTSPKDDYAWALIGGVWQYTKQATPGAKNEVGENGEVLAESSSTSSSKPCASNQFRNPETGRCKLISLTESTQTPCKENQERNPETNRCRNIASTAAPAPCKEGQERNPETNRCRAIVKMSEAGHGVGVQSKADAAMTWYYWAGIVAIVLLVVGYALWEWRQELSAVWVRMRTAFAKHSE